MQSTIKATKIYETENYSILFMFKTLQNLFFVVSVHK